ncbi:DUF389 domain-containing protein [Nocardioides bruguierae]|uniref:DUF389 domain-containing protein n=1 Tax=Nocardioides bruguierae TaxID=2945102 RepID=A0A9X2D5F2_9ACTN|nr:DUF389 domain-containing protein [Nocardioides bruguierae]MCM0619486.1 DUF389 domain-containing protein [Nocardioides bruguierae]
MRVPGITPLTDADVHRITGSFFLEGPDRGRVLSAFWVLLVLSAVIAAAGVIADSVATVIGAMIVAPLMRPILGTACAVVLARHRQIVLNVLLVVAGAASVVLVGYLLGALVQLPVTADTNSQVAGRVSPRLIDLVAALATGVVGAYALTRADVADSLPGVAIAISLVPPLAVVGLTLESGEPGQAAGALLLFGTNVAAIIATGTLVLLVARFRHAAQEAGVPVRRLAGRSLVIVIASVLVVSVPLAVGSRTVLREQLVVADAEPVARAWADGQGWELTDVELRNGTLVVVVIGPEARPDLAGLRPLLDEAGLADVDLDVTFLAGDSVLQPATA